MLLHAQIAPQVDSPTQMEAQHAQCVDQAGMHNTIPPLHAMTVQLVGFSQQKVSQAALCLLLDRLLPEHHTLSMYLWVGQLWIVTKMVCALTCKLVVKAHMTTVRGVAFHARQAGQALKGKRHAIRVTRASTLRWREVSVWSVLQDGFRIKTSSQV